MHHKLLRRLRYIWVVNPTYTFTDDYNHIEQYHLCKWEDGHLVELTKYPFNTYKHCNDVKNAYIRAYWYQELPTRYKLYHKYNVIKRKFKRWVKHTNTRVHRLMLSSVIV